MRYEPKENFGRPSIPAEKIKEVEEYAMRGESPKKAIEKTGVKQTKVYEIYRLHRAKAGGT